MNKRTETALFWAATIDIVLLGLLAASSNTTRQISEQIPVWGYFVGPPVGAVAAVFQFWMLFECAFGSRPVKQRGFWILFLMLVPMVSAIIYFMFTRSKTLDSEAQRPT